MPGSHGGRAQATGAVDHNISGGSQENVSPSNSQDTGSSKNCTPRESWQQVSNAKQEIKWLSKAIREVGNAPEGGALVALSALLAAWDSLWHYGLEAEGESPAPRSPLRSEVQQVHRTLCDEAHLAGLGSEADVREALVTRLTAIKRDRIRTACKAAVASAGSTIQYLGRMSRDAADKFAHVSVKASATQSAAMNRRLWDVSFEQGNQSRDELQGPDGHGSGAHCAGLTALPLSPIQINSPSNPQVRESSIDDWGSAPKILEAVSLRVGGQTHSSLKDAGSKENVRPRGCLVGYAEAEEAMVTVFDNRHQAGVESTDLEEAPVKMRGMKEGVMGMSNPLATESGEVSSSLLSELRRECLAEAAVKAKESAMKGEAEKALSQALADLALSRSLVSWLTAKHMNGHRSLDAKQAAEWLARAVDSPLDELTEQLGLDLDSPGTGGGQLPLVLELSELMHSMVYTLRRAERKEKRNRNLVPKMKHAKPNGSATHSLAVTRSLPVLARMPR